MIELRFRQESMKEIKAIIQAYTSAAGQGLRAALVTVVHVEGSSYRRPGARMLVTEEGRLTGAISGGCLEGDALRKALYVMEKKSPMLVTLFSMQQRGSQPGTCLVSKGGDLIFPGPVNASYYHQLLADVEKSRLARQSFFRAYQSGGEHITAFLHYISPPVSLVIFGSGDDVDPLVQLAVILGWQPTVVSGKNGNLPGGRFAACGFFNSNDAWLAAQAADEQTVFVIMTHSYSSDKDCLKTVLGVPGRYIGVLGPKVKLQRMLAELEAEGVPVGASRVNNVYGPAGLDIGAETPEEIALSIASEIQAVLAGKAGHFLRNRPDVIHPRSETMIEAVRVDSGRVNTG
jgi:xanthine dehydrogenase accessory factor